MKKPSQETCLVVLVIVGDGKAYGFLTVGFSFFILYLKGRIIL